MNAYVTFFPFCLWPTYSRKLYFNDEVFKKLSLRREIIELDRPPLDSKIISAPSALSPILHSQNSCSSSVNDFCPLAIILKTVLWIIACILVFSRRKKHSNELVFDFFFLFHNNDIIGILAKQCVRRFNFFFITKGRLFFIPKRSFARGKVSEFQDSQEAIKWMSCCIVLLLRSNIMKI